MIMKLRYLNKFKLLIMYVLFSIRIVLQGACIIIPRRGMIISCFLKLGVNRVYILFSISYGLQNIDNKAAV
ncbi:hypothetical protein Xszus_01593 [Xenorhabdus szentirmaii]|nr:hypothetical protein Xsze_02442 [Xenorhabdus szentirmaii DSM 16338]PHM41886.1 hypothetical protein Xszus_01593 [Xenorhabdus szentirmaii]